MNHDELFRRRFAELRHVERAGTPALDAVLHRARPGRHGARRVVAVTLALAASVVLALVLRPRQPKPFGIDITTWTAPTDALLPGSATGVLGAMPPLGASVVDQYIDNQLPGDD